MTDYKLVPVELLKDWHKRINTIATETAFNIADEMESILDTTPDVQSTFTVGTDLSDGKLAVVVMKHENGITWVIHSEVIQPAEQQPGLVEALRQYQHNDGSGLVFGYDRLLVDQYVTQLVEALEECAASLAWNCFGECRAIHDGPIMPASGALEMARKALAAHKKEGSDV